MEATRLLQPQVGLTYDCDPTLNDYEVFEFCRQGYLMLEAVVEDEINQRMMEYIAAHPDEHQPLELLFADWFVDGVFKTPQAAGAVRALLGADLGKSEFQGGDDASESHNACCWEGDENLYKL